MKNAIAILVLSTSAAFAQNPPVIVNIQSPDNTVSNDITAIQNACAKLSSDLQGIQTDIQAVQAAGGVVFANPPAPVVSSDNTTIPPAASILTAAGDTWTLSGTTVVRNGIPQIGSVAASMLYKGGNIFHVNFNKEWWEWNGTTWHNVQAP